MIGFRLPREMICETLLQDYFKNFDFLEIKIGDSISDSELEELIRLLLKDTKFAKFSLHLPKNSLYDLEQYETCIKILKRIAKYKIKQINLVVHFVFYDSTIIKRIVYLVSILKEQETLLIENICQFSKNNKYISELEDALKIVDSLNLGFCMDWGHYLFGTSKEGVEQGKAIDILLNHTELIKKIRELHIHDFNQQRDHLTIGTGNMKIDLIFKKLSINVPVIIETTVKNPKKDGIDQVMSIQTARSKAYANS